MTRRNNIHKIRMALDVLRESEALWLRLAVSIRSGSSDDIFVGINLKAFFRSSRRSLFIQLGIGYLKMVSGRSSEVTLTVFRALWLKMTNAVKSSS
jgi:hypothetical protein